jgi:Skp family chaperone for outer membrane proteins
MADAAPLAAPAPLGIKPKEPKSALENTADIKAATEKIKELKEKRDELINPKSEEAKEAAFKADLDKLNKAADRKKNEDTLAKLEKKLDADPKDAELKAKVAKLNAKVA